MSYILFVNDQEHGPYSIDDLIEAVNQESISENTMARKIESEDWCEVSIIIRHHQKIISTPEKVDPVLPILIPSKASYADSNKPKISKKLTDKKPKVIGRPNHRNQPDKFQISQSIKNPWFITAHYVIGVLCLSLGVLLLILGLAEPAQGLIVNSVIFLALGISLLITGVLMSWLHEIVKRIRNIDINTQ